MSDGPRPKTFDQNYDRYKRSKREEDRIADKLGGRRLPRSGGLAWSKSDTTTDGGDIAGKHFLVEHKRVEPHVKSVSIKRDWLKKVTDGAKRRLKLPALVVTFQEAQGFTEDWIMMPLEDAKRLLDVELADDEEG